MKRNETKRFHNFLYYCNKKSINRKKFSIFLNECRLSRCYTRWPSLIIYVVSRSFFFFTIHILNMETKYENSHCHNNLLRSCMSYTLHEGNLHRYLYFFFRLNSHKFLAHFHFSNINIADSANNFNQSLNYSIFDFQSYYILPRNNPQSTS